MPSHTRFSSAGCIRYLANTRRNRSWAEGFATFAGEVDEPHRWLVCDAMTSGGLLAGVDPARAGEIPGAVIGRLVAGAPGTITVRT